MLLRGGVFRLGTDSSAWVQDDNARGNDLGDTEVKNFAVWGCLLAGHRFFGGASE